MMSRMLGRLVAGWGRVRLFRAGANACAKIIAAIEMTAAVLKRWRNLFSIWVFVPCSETNVDLRPVCRLSPSAALVRTLKILQSKLFWRADADYSGLHFHFAPK